MPGVRIQHPTERDALFTLIDQKRPYPEPFQCPPINGCGKVHLFKTYHFRLDATGAAIVSREIVDRLKRIPGQPFEISNEVEKPPAQTVSVVGKVPISGA